MPHSTARLRFGVIGVDHDHIHGMVEAIERGGGELVSFHAEEPRLATAFGAKHPGAEQVDDEGAVLEDSSISLVLSSIVPSSRAALGIRVMRHDKDFLADKPGVTRLEDLADARRVQAETGRIYSILYSERLESRATIRAADLVRNGAIGRVVQTIGLGPHRLHPPARPAWFWDAEQQGGILCDIGSHQFDQFLFFTNSRSAEIVSAQVRNVGHPGHPEFHDFGDAIVRGDGGTGYLRVDWFTPAGLPTWGDGRLTVLRTDGYLEVRKYVDIGGRAGGDHLYLVDRDGVRYIDCADVELPFGRQLVDDVLNRTETAMSQAHCFLAAELAIEAQRVAVPIG